MGDIINISNIHDYNEFLGIETLNPLVTFIDFREVKVLKHKRKYYGFYGIYLKEKILLNWVLPKEQNWELVLLSNNLLNLKV